MICLYFKITENFMHLILKDRFWFVHIPFGCIISIKSLAQFLVDHLSQPVVPIIIILLISLRVSHWSLNDIRFPLVSRTLLSILANLNNAVVWMVSTRPLLSKSYSPCTNPLVTTERTNYNWYPRHLHLPQVFQFSGKV